MKKLTSFIFIPIIFSLIISCKTGTHLSEPEVSGENNSSMSQYGDQKDLRLFLADFITSVESGNWGNVLSFFDRENFLEQSSIGVGVSQYLIEGMGLPSDEFIDENNSLNIDHLKSLVVKKIVYGDDCYAQVRGEAFLSRGRKVEFTLRIRRDSDGNFSINPPIG